MTDPKPTVSDRFTALAARLKTLAAVTEHCQQYSILPVRSDRITYALHEAQHQAALLEQLIRELAEIHLVNAGENPAKGPQQSPGAERKFQLCPENDTTTSSPKAHGKDAAPASS